MFSTVLDHFLLTAKLLVQAACDVICGHVGRPALKLFLAAALVGSSACSTQSLVATAPSPANTTPATNPTNKTTQAATAPKQQYSNFTEEQLSRSITAELALQRGQFAQALEIYTALARETHNLSFLQRTARVASITRQSSLAIEMTQLWLAEEPDSAEARQTMALQFITESRFRDAFEQFKILLDQGNKVDFRLLSARVAASVNAGGMVLLKGLLNDYETLLRSHPHHDSLRLSLAHLYQLDKQLKPALAIIEQLEKEVETRKPAEATPEQEPVRAGDLLVLEVQLLDQMQEPQLSLRRIQQGIKNYPEHKELRLLYGRRLISDRNFAEAKNQFAILLEQNPNDYDLLYSLALLSMEVNLYGEARNYLQRLVLNGQRLDDVHYYLGFIDGQEKHNAQAIDHYLQVKGGSNFLQTQRNLTDLMVKAGRYDEVRSHLQNIRFRNADLNIPLLSMEANVLIVEKHYEQASTLLNSAVVAFPNNAELLFARSVLSQDTNDLALMESDLRKIIMLEPQSPVAYNSLGYTLADRTTRYQEAYELIQKAISLTPNDPAIIDSLGWVQYKLGLYSEAKTNLNRAYKLFSDAEVAAHLGEVLWVMGEKTEAAKVWREALAKQPESEHLRDTMRRLEPANAL